jgi:hypothetical protein
MKTVIELAFLATQPIRKLPLWEEERFKYPDLSELGVPVLLAAEAMLSRPSRRRL